MRYNNSLFISILCIVLIFIFVFVAFVIAPYALNAIQHKLEYTVAPDSAILLFIFIVMIACLLIAYVLALLLRSKRMKESKIKIINEIPSMYGNYDRDRKYLEDRINDLSDKLVSTQKRWDEAYHLILSSNDRSSSNSGILTSNEFLSTYNINPNEIEIDEKQIFILTPFNSSSVEDYLVIRSTCNESGFHAIRGDEVSVEGEIFPHIISLISKSRLVIANINGRNPNVFYELGIAHMMNKSTIFVSRIGQDIPFDLKTKRVIFYESQDDLHNKLYNALQQYSKDNNDVVYNEINDYTVSSIAQKVKRIVNIYRQDTQKKEYVVELLKPIFAPAAKAKMVILDGKNVRSSFIAILGKKNMAILKRLLNDVDSEYYSDVMY